MVEPLVVGAVRYQIKAEIIEKHKRYIIVDCGIPVTVILDNKPINFDVGTFIEFEAEFYIELSFGLGHPSNHWVKGIIKGPYTGNVIEFEPV